MGCGGGKWVFVLGISPTKDCAASALTLVVANFLKRALY
jgi:hypothetical protein